MISLPRVFKEKEIQGLKDNWLRPRFRRLVVQFLAGWLVSVLLVLGVALLRHADWYRPQCELALSEIFHRHIKLGHISWSLGLNGLAISAQKIQAYERDGTPLLMSGRSEIGIAFLPLFTGELIIKHLDFQKPEIWAVKTANNTWNFEDLIKNGPEIRIIQLDKGRMHIVDRSKTRAHSILMDDVKLKFVFPKKKRAKPFYLAFKLNKPGYTTDFQLNGLGGAEENWHKNFYTFDAQANNVNPDDVQNLIAYFGQGAGGDQSRSTRVEGLFDVKLKGEGTFEKGVKATAQMDVDGLVVTDAKLGKMKAPKARSEANLTVDKDKLSWKDMSLNLANIKLTSQGHLHRWRESNRGYSAQIAGKVEDLKSLKELFPDRDRESGDASTAVSMLGDIKKERLSGRAEIMINIQGNLDRAEIESRIRAGGVAARDLLEHTTSGSARLLILVGVPETANMKGDVKVIAGERIDVADGEIDVPGGTLKMKGWTDLKSDRSEYGVTINSLDLAGVEKNLNSSPTAALELARTLSLPPRSRIVLSGKAQVGATVRRQGARSNFAVTTVLNNASIALADKPFSLSRLNGTINLTEKMSEFRHLTGNIGDGSFSLNGVVQANSHAPVDLFFKGEKIDLQQVHQTLDMFKISLPVFKDERLAGRLKEVTFSVKGSLDRPQLALEAVPDDVQFIPSPGMKPVRLTSGLISLKNNELTVKELAVALRGSTVTTSMHAKDLATRPQLTKVEFKSQSLDLSDVDYYVNSSACPPSLKKQYSDALTEFDIDNVHGKIYGDVRLTPHNNKLKFDGVVGLNNVSANVGPKSIHVDKLTGVLAATGQELLLQNITGQVNHSNFSIDGYVNKYGTPQVNWTADMKASVESREIGDLIRMLSASGSVDQVKVVSQGPVRLNAKVSGNRETTAVSFWLRADSKSNLALSGPFGTIRQPMGEAMSIDGALASTADELNIKDSHIIVGQSVLNTSGTILWKEKPEINLAFSSPNPLPAARCLAALYPDLVEQDTSGLIDVDLKIKGHLANPEIEGAIGMDRISIPRLSVFDATGKLTTTEAFDPRSGKTPFSSILNLKSVKLGYMMVKDLSGEVNLRPVQGQFRTPKLAISNGKATVADGKLNFSMIMDLDEHKLGVKAKLDDVKAAEIGSWLFGHDGEITGIADADIAVRTEGKNKEEMIANLSGKGKLSIHNGSLARFGHLQQRLTQANLLQSGVLGFNFNNLLQSVVPVRTGNFKELSGSFKIAAGEIALKDLKFNGDDMRLWGAGTADLPTGNLNLEIAGTIPRVQSSIIGGPIGKVSKRITVQKLLNTVTFGKLEQLPSLPVLGDLASDKPRTFTFNMSAQVEEPKVLTQSIEKSFKWLPSKPLASAHPIIGMDLN